MDKKQLLLLIERFGTECYSDGVYGDGRSNASMDVLDSIKELLNSPNKVYNICLAQICETCLEQYIPKQS